MSSPVIPPVIFLDAITTSSKEYGKFKPFEKMGLTSVVTKTAQALRDNEAKLFAEEIFDQTSPYTVEAEQSRLLLDTVTISYGPLYKLPVNYKPGDYVFLPSLRGRLILNEKDHPKTTNLKMQIFPEQQIEIQNTGASTVFVSKHMFTPTETRAETDEKVDLPHRTDAVATLRMGPNTIHRY